MIGACGADMQVLTYNRLAMAVDLACDRPWLKVHHRIAQLRDICPRSRQKLSIASIMKKLSVLWSEQLAM